MEKNKINDIVFEKCVLCGVQTNVPVDAHINSRVNYVEGAGQLCHLCASKNTTKK